VVALEAGTGRALWTYSRPPTPGLVGDSRLGTNRGVALRQDKVYFVTDNAHLLALDRGTGALQWEISMAPEAPPSEGRHHYGGTIAPLVVRDMVVAGVAGADEGIRGFVAAFNAETGATYGAAGPVPRQGERGIETWQGRSRSEAAGPPG
jgi:alcohol dehydrogenase (cytochrome c)